MVAIVIENHNVSEYFTDTSESLGHTPIYKIHKYFARRPHNRFRSIIEHYVDPYGIVLDCFSGGGVTLIEGLTSERRVISVDINPIACLVQLGEVLEVPAARVIEITDLCASNVPLAHRQWYEAICSKCCKPAHVRWYEHAYLVRCKACGSKTDLSNEAKVRNGMYRCNRCQAEFKAVDCRRVGSRVLSLRLRCDSCGVQEHRPASESEQALSDQICSQEGQLAEEFALSIPQDLIPLSWDRQAEDALSRKGFDRFADLFTPRNRIIMAHLFKALTTERLTLKEDEYVAALVVLSALLRYTNSMTFSTSSWMDGRPVAWAKHAYWTPNQFVEVNPFEYLQHRQEAMKRAERDRITRFSGKRRAATPSEVLRGEADYTVLCQDARSVELPDASVDAVITDPPFGSNVQYGELSHLWSVWLRDLTPLGGPFDLSPEILTHRKRQTGAKRLPEYRESLTAVFAECFRVLRPTGVLCFTFNNREPGAWYAVMAAAIDAGFCLEPEGIVYQDEIKAYRDTAHLRFDSELQGDILYTFRKNPLAPLPTPTTVEPAIWLRRYLTNRIDSKLNAIGRRDLAIDLHVAVVREAAAQLQGQRSRAEVEEWLALLRATVAQRILEGAASSEYA